MAAELDGCWLCWSAAPLPVSRSRSLPLSPSLPPCSAARYNNPAAAAMIALFATGRARPQPRSYRGRSAFPLHPAPRTLVFSYQLQTPSVTPEPSELHFLFRPTRKRPRQATPPPRHRGQQQARPASAAQPKR
ncbi:hypothetical protein SRHO_G00114300 [Serrasalmus rhombeus]